MRCPICLQKTKKPTKEHLPFKALYKNLSQKQDNAAIIKICKECNSEKSIWDQEFLAVYGHLLDIKRAQLSQKALKKVESVNDALHFCLVASRCNHMHGEPLVKRYNLECNLITQWFWMCGRGIYFFFEKKPFEGNRVFIRPEVIDHNTEADKFSFKLNSDSRHGCKYYKINEFCYIWIMRKENQSPMVAMSMINKSTNRIFSVSGHFVEDESQLIADRDYASNLNINKKPIRIAQPREIFDVPVHPDGFSYKGIKRLD